MNSTPTLAIVLVDALAASYIRPETMPFLSRLSTQGKKVALEPSPFYSGVDPILYGVSGEALGRFIGYQFDPDRSPYLKISQKQLQRLDSLPKNRVGKLLRTIGARRLLKKSGDSTWLAPQFFPATLLKQIAPPLPEKNPDTHLIHKIESKGIKAKWYTRDFPYEGKKWWGSQLFAIKYQNKLKQWVLETDDQESFEVILFEWSVLLDRLGHRYGPRLEGPLVAGSKKIDGQLQEIWNAMQSRPNLHWLVISDHGMSQVDRTWDLKGALQKAGLFKNLESATLINSTLAQFSVPDLRLKQELIALLEESKQGTVIPYESYNQYSIPADNHWGDLIFAVPEGTLLLPNHFQGSSPVRGMHGYLKSSQESSKPVALFWGSSWDLSQVHTEMKMEEVYPVILNLYEKS